MLKLALTSQDLNKPSALLPVKLWCWLASLNAVVAVKVIGKFRQECYTGSRANSVIWISLALPVPPTTGTYKKS